MAAEMAITAPTERSRIIENVNQVPIQMAIHDPDFKEAGGKNRICQQDQGQRNDGPKQTVLTNAFEQGNVVFHKFPAIV
jgi:hypothetical protein